MCQNQKFPISAPFRVAVGSEISPTPASNANAHVIRPFGSALPLQLLHFPHLRFTAPEFWATRWNRTRLHTSYPQQPAVEIHNASAIVSRRRDSAVRKSSET